MVELNRLVIHNADANTRVGASKITDKGAHLAFGGLKQLRYLKIAEEFVNVSYLASYTGYCFIGKSNIF